MKKLTLPLILLSLLLSSCSTSRGKASSDVVIEASIPTENGDLTLVLWPEPALHGKLEFVIGE